ncbi:TetR/AcrR family transcriptional regulator [Mycobacterium sp. IEC1808]|uniref:TetR/AcrR family transcriptional regulator n=1 Tax=Mycobacterium sp. IEC1808 TaxID=1743230 RepID=UPI001F4D5C1A|nr:TetR/AcrR family transcriptional regulator [Mycobacterium sp. IEC1808]
MAIRGVTNGRDSGPPRRRRRAPAEARREILEAAAGLLAEQPAHAVSVAAIMDRTTLSRKSFYVYFRDRAELIGALVRPLRVEADAALARWRQAEDPVAAGREALVSAADTYRRHGAILRAVFWSSGTDPEVAAARSALIDPVIDVAEAIIDGADSNLDDPRGAATALVTMNVHRLLTLTPDTSDAEMRALVDTLATIWKRTIYSGKG